MPIYEYTCSGCGCEFEVFHRTTQEERPTCPGCGTAQVERTFSVFGFSCGGSVVSSSKEANCGSCHARNCSHCG